MRDMFLTALEELKKLAALSPQEQEFYTQTIKNHAAYDVKAGQGKLSPDEQAAMRHNVDRIKHFKEKKKSDSYNIPDWAKTHKGKPPEANPHRGGGSSRSEYKPPSGAGGSGRGSWWDDFEAGQKARQKAHEAHRAASDARWNATKNKWRAEDAERAAESAKKWHAAESARNVHAGRRRAITLGLTGLAAGGLIAHRLHKEHQKAQATGARKKVPMSKAACIDELQKLGAISDEEAQESLHQIGKIESNKPTAGQVGRYAGLGAASAPAVGVMKNVIKGKPLIDAAGHMGKLRHVGAEAAGGALLMGALPLVRSHLDRRAEVKKLRTYLKEQGESV